MSMKGNRMSLNSFYTPLRYPGGKGKLVPYVKKILEENDLIDGEYAEPYAGGAAVAVELLLHEYVRKIHINDISAGVAAFWRSVLYNTDALCALISDTPVTMGEWHKQRAVQRRREEDGDDLSLGFSTFFMNRTNRSGILSAGVIGGKNQDGAWKLDARYNKIELIRRIESIARIKGRISFTQEDAVVFVKKIVSKLPEKSLTYFDPPYYIKGSNLYHHYYEHRDHVDISKRVSQLKKNWIVSYDNVQEIHALYSKYRGIVYGLSYSAQDRYKGSEAMFFSNQLLIPETVAPMHLAA